MQKKDLDKRDQAALELVKPLLASGEKIERIFEVQHLSVPFRLVLTNKRFFLALYIASKKAKEKYHPVSFSRYLVKQVTYKKFNATLQLHLAADILNLKVPRREARGQAADLAENYRHMGKSKLSGSALLDDLTTLEQEFGTLGTIEQEAKQVYGENDRREAFIQFIKERKLTFTAAAWMLVSYLIISVTLDLLLGGGLGAFLNNSLLYLIMVFLAFSLFRRNPNARTWTVAAAIFPLLIAVIDQFSQVDVLSLLYAAAFTASFSLVLIGKPVRGKTLAGALLFMIACLGPLLFVGVSYFLQ